MAQQTDKKRKAAALADLLDGHQPAVVALRYKLNAATVRSWKARLDADTLQPATGAATPAAAVMRQPALEAQQLALGQLVEENLRAKLIATQKIAEHVTKTPWLDKQTASDMAILFTALDRSAVDILDRLAARSARIAAGEGTDANGDGDG